METLFEETRPLLIGPAPWALRVSLVEDAQGFLLRGAVVPAAAATTEHVDRCVGALYAYPVEAQLAYAFGHDAAGAEVRGAAVLATTGVPMTGGEMVYALAGARQARTLLALLDNGVPAGHYRWSAWLPEDYEKHLRGLAAFDLPGLPEAGTGLYRLPRCLLAGAAAAHERDEILRRLVPAAP